MRPRTTRRSRPSPGPGPIARRASPVTDVRRPEEPLGVAGHQLLLGTRRRRAPQVRELDVVVPVLPQRHEGLLAPYEPGRAPWLSRSVTSGKAGQMVRSRSTFTVRILPGCRSRRNAWCCAASARRRGGPRGLPVRPGRSPASSPGHAVLARTGPRRVRASRPADPAEPGWFQYAIECTADRGHIGDVGVQPAREPAAGRDRLHARPAYQGRGYATEAVRGVLAHLFGVRGLHKVSAECDARNALGPAAGAGRFHPRGFRRQHTWLKDEWTDDLLFGLLAADWPRTGPERPAPGRRLGRSPDRSTPARRPAPSGQPS